ncbi:MULTISPECIES: outer membrane-stress sensor serine endopeptidase DegS [unclassified Serratia (in: enterobacteria)]|uniref:outer membrane-stress sensor serine endopeptidase DegS n=1 Tax=unclassified Serratia (in: enterobacteria) TaxID=2647522 RepID=UPI000506D126|nr:MULTISPECIES: outer membrane-stress sensor serine endopeptidase DegS [unclassified Serratia (in: enterobacteria)]KFK95373.1 serine endoprotease [Serratia sp. Ag2]KFK98721.1 serine endoprotease [Serratia sp. Ag1]
MFAKLLRSVIIGLIVAGLLLVALPVLRSSNNIFASKPDNSSNEAPASYNIGVRRAAPAVVNIYNRNISGTTNVLSLGSGVIMNDRGYIITNRHVIKDAQLITVVLQDGRRYEALLVGSDSLTDLAVLKIDPGNLPVIPINNQRPAHIGDVVLAIGNPYNLGQTVTQGIISATGRISLSTTGRQTFLQTDASINRGNSGGALVNSLGELMGINTLTYDKVTDGETPEGLGFAIPTALATKIMDKLIRDGRVIRGYFGIQGKEIIPVRTSNTGIDRLQGIIVTEISPNGPAASAGFHINDIIINVDNKPAVAVLETMDQVAEIRPGTEIPVVVLREGKRLTLKMTVGEFPEDNS